MLVATFISEDWRACMDAVRSYGQEDAETHLRRVYDALRGFAASYRKLFLDTEARKSYRASASRWHGELRAQLASLILPNVLHFAACRITLDGFNCLVVLERGTNEELDDVDTKADREEALLWKRNKWLLCHPESPQASNGAFVGITGENLTVSL